MPCGAQLHCVAGFSWTIMQMPGGTIGVQLKSMGPCSCTQAERHWLMHDPLSKLSVSSAWGRSQSQRWMGNLLSVLQSLEMKWFLKVWMAHSAALRQWTCGGTNWKSMVSAVMNSCSEHEASLSRPWSWGWSPTAQSQACPCLYASKMASAHHVLNGCHCCHNCRWLECSCCQN